MWVLRSRYGYKKSEIVAAVEDLAAVDRIEFQSASAVRQALDRYRTGPAGFADCLIGAENLIAGCAETATFDRRLSLADGFARPGNARHSARS